MRSLFILLTLFSISLSQEDEDKRNPALEVAGTAALGAGLLGGLLLGGAALAKAVGDAARDGDSARSNGGNIVRQHHLAHVSDSGSDQCSYNCDGWPYEQCGMSSRLSSATCINPYTDTQGSQIFSNYPECANVPSGCERCDDVCSRRDGNKDKLDYRSDHPSSIINRHHQPSPTRRPQRPSSSHSQVCDYQCQSNGGCTATYVGRSRPGKHQGSCFPDEFGGSCSGTPNECHNCNQVLSCSPEEKQKSAFDTRHLGDQTTRNCDYKCNASGTKGDRGCTVRYIGPNRPGQTSGSCFSDSFGGGCSGTPRECVDCNRAIFC